MSPLNRLFSALKEEFVSSRSRSSANIRDVEKEVDELYQQNLDKLSKKKHAQEEKHQREREQAQVWEQGREIARDEAQNAFEIQMHEAQQEAELSRQARVAALEKNHREHIARMEQLSAEKLIEPDVSVYVAPKPLPVAPSTDSPTEEEPPKFGSGFGASFGKGFGSGS